MTSREPDVRPTSLSMTVLMTPDMANFSGKVHGGALLKLLDEFAYSCASRYAGHYVVTLSVDRVLSREAIHVGELVTFSAMVNFVGSTSMEIGIRHVNSSYFTMVAVGDDGQPAGVPPLEPTTGTAARRFADARRRREALRAAFTSG